MTKPFPQPMAGGLDEPCRFDIEVFDLEITEGEVPADIDGLLTQAVPDQFYPTEVEFLDPMTIAAGGDGAVRAFRIKDGHIDFASKYVRTERYLAERAARRSLYGNYRNPFTDDPSVKGQSRTTANTATYMHAGHLLASKEDGLAYEVDPETFETIGAWNAEGGIKSLTWTAHPKFDSATGEMYGFGYAAKGECTKDIAYYVIGSDGLVKHEVWFEAPVTAMIHDCALTENYMLFPVMPIASDLERMKAGGPHYIYDAKMPQYFGVIPRKGTAADVRWFEAPHAFPGHTINAYEEDGKIVFDVLEAEGNGFNAVISDGSGRLDPPGTIPVNAVRWRIDYNSNSLQLGEADREVLVQINGEGAHIHPRYELKPYRHIFVPTCDRSKIAVDKSGRVFPVMFNQLSHFDLETKARDDWFPGPGGTFQDPVFVPKRSDGPEDEGYVIAILGWPMEKQSELVILDAQNLSAGPVARAKVPVRLRQGIHSTWTSARQLNARKG